MAVIEMQKEPRSIKAMLFVACLVLAFLALAGGIYWLVKPATPRQIKLTGEQAKEAEASFAPAPVNLPKQDPVPLGKDPGPTLVTLDLKQVTPRQAVQELAKQANIDIRDDGRGGQQQGFFASLLTQRIDVSVKNEPFWAAVLDVCRKGRLVPYTDYQSPDRISFAQGNPSQALGPSVTAGSCAIVLESVTSRFDANLTGPRPPERTLRVALKLFVEPRLKTYRISPIATLETAVDEVGNNLIRPTNIWDDRSGGGRQSNWMREIGCNLLFPENAGSTIKTLRGYASMAVAGADKTEKIADPLKNKNVDVKIDGTLVRFVEIRRQGNNVYIVRMAGDANSPVFREYDKFRNVVALFDANGKEFQHSGGSWGGPRGNTMEYSVHFTAADDASDPAELRVTLPTQLREIRVPFEFHDLPLPH